MRNKIVPDNLKEISKETGRACVCFNLRKGSRLLSQVYDQALKPSGLKVTQFSLMMAVAGNDSVTIGKLARPLGMDRTTLSRNAKILKKKGLLEIREGDDRREQILNLTHKGELILLEAIPLWEKVQKQLTEKMGDKGLNQFLSDLRDLAREFR